MSEHSVMPCSVAMGFTTSTLQFSMVTDDEHFFSHAITDSLFKYFCACKSSIAVSSWSHKSSPLLLHYFCHSSFFLVMLFLVRFYFVYAAAHLSWSCLLAYCSANSSSLICLGSACEVSFLPPISTLSICKFWKGQDLLWCNQNNRYNIGMICRQIQQRLNFSFFIWLTIHISTPGINTNKGKCTSDIVH